MNLRQIPQLLVCLTFPLLCGFFFIIPIPKGGHEKVMDMARAQDWHGIVNYTSENLKSDPSDYVAYTYRCWARTNLKQFDAAQADCEAAISFKSDHPDAHNTYAWLHMVRGQYEQALPRLKRAIDLRPEYPIALMNLGIVYHELGEQEQAYEIHRRLSVIDQSRAAALKSTLANPKSRPAAAPSTAPVVESIKRNEAQDSKSRQVDGSRIDPAKTELRGDARESLDDLQRVAMSDPTNAASWTKLGDEYVRLGQVDNGVKALEKAVALNNRDTGALTSLGAVYFKMGRRADVDAIWERLRALDKAAAEAFFAKYVLS